MADDVQWVDIVGMDMKSATGDNLRLAGPRLSTRRKRDSSATLADGNSLLQGPVPR